MKKPDVSLASVAAKLRGKVLFLILTAICVLAIVAGIAPLYRWHLKRYDIVIAAGSARAESYALMESLRVVVAHYYPEIRITVNETTGTPESLRRLDSGDVQLAIAQAGIAPGPRARTVAVLFEDRFQLIVHRTPPLDAAPLPLKRPVAVADKNPPAPSTADAGIQHFTDLKGKRIALQRSGAEFRSFILLANHFGLKESDFIFVGGDDASADLAFEHNDADAIFRIRSLHTESLEQILRGGTTALVPIEDAAALHEMDPAYQPAIIPKGYYMGNPAMPPADLPTVGTSRMLLAREDVDDEVIYAITETLIEHRSELALNVRPSQEQVRPLALLSSAPPAGTGTDAPRHPGADQFYLTDRTSFVGAHADFLVWLGGLICLIAWWIFELRRVMEWNRKLVADGYTGKILVLMKEAEAAESIEELEPVHAEYTGMMAAAILDLENNRLSHSSFESFHTVWQLAMDAFARCQYSIELRADAPKKVEKDWNLGLGRLLQPRN